MKLSTPILGQRDPKWASQRLGTVDGTTIGGYGCFITCVSMVLQYYGYDVNPAQLDNWLTDNQGYTDGDNHYSPKDPANLLVPDSISRLFWDIALFENASFLNSPAPLNRINDSLMAGHPVIIEVDFDHDPNDGIQTHFVVIVGVMPDGTYIINDPWFNDQVFLTGRYAMGGITQAQAIDQITIYIGPLSKSPEVYPSPILTPSDHTPTVVEPIPSPSPSVSPSSSLSGSPSSSPSASPSEAIIDNTSPETPLETARKGGNNDLVHAVLLDLESLLKSLLGVNK